jgi:hypothetical protein
MGQDNRTISNKFEWHKELRKDRRGGNLTEMEYRFLSTMFDYASMDGGDVRPGNKNLAEHLGIGVRQVGRYISKFIGLGWLRLDQAAVGPGRGGIDNKGQNATYSLTMPPETSDTQGVRSFTETSDISGLKHRTYPEKTSDIHGCLPTSQPTNQDQSKNQENPWLSSPVVQVGTCPSSAREDNPDRYWCSECFESFDGHPPQKHQTTGQPVCADCVPF